MRSSGAKSANTRRPCSALWLRSGNALVVTHSSNLLSGRERTEPPGGRSADRSALESRLFGITLWRLSALWGCYATAVQALATKWSRSAPFVDGAAEPKPSAVAHSRHD